MRPYHEAMTPGFCFELERERGAARLARYRTPHGVIDTPAFVAVGTQATVKGVTPEMVGEAGTQALFCNTYHLYLRPGAEVVAGLGGLHPFMNWSGPIMTDSGGFQVFSLGAGLEHGVGKIANIFPGEAGGVLATPGARAPEGKSLVTVGEDEVRFKSHLDGSEHVFTPETSIAVQRALGADIILAFDECTSPLHDLDYTRRSMARTHRWAERSLHAFGASEAQHDHPQALYGVVQGGAFESLRKESARTIAAMTVAGRGFDGIAIGGNLGKTKEEMHRVIDWAVAELPRGKPRHLLGIGDVEDIFAAVERGCDTFDSVGPTRIARNGAVLARHDDEGRPLTRFRLNLKNARFAADPRPISKTCGCYTCLHYSRAYLRHLFKADELLARTLATVHNLHFMARLCAEIRRALLEDSFGELKRAWLGEGSHFLH